MNPNPQVGLALEDLEISQFRAFEHLYIKKLGRVNLFVGKNNTGKTSLLEALRAYMGDGYLHVLSDIVMARDEHRLAATNGELRSPDATVLLSLFHGRRAPEDITQPIEIGPSGRKLRITLQWVQEVVQGEGEVKLEPLSGLLSDPDEEALPALAVKSSKGTRHVRLDRALARRLFPALADPAPPCVFVGSNGIRGDERARMWDRVVLSDFEKEITTSLQIISPEVERISFIGDERNQQRIPIARLRDLSRPIPLRSLGDGVNRLFEMALSLISAKDGLLLLDEIENGIHYSIQDEVWRFLLTNAQRLNVQVFATTHSWDCVKAFHRTMRDQRDEQGVLTRLELRKGAITASQFSEEELGIATRESIEIR